MFPSIPELSALLKSIQAAPSQGASQSLFATAGGEGKAGDFSAVFASLLSQLGVTPAETTGTVQTTPETDVDASSEDMAAVIIGLLAQRLGMTPADATATPQTGSATPLGGLEAMNQLAWSVWRQMQAGQTGDAQPAAPAPTSTTPASTTPVSTTPAIPATVVVPVSTLPVPKEAGITSASEATSIPVPASEVKLITDMVTPVMDEAVATIPASPVTKTQPAVVQLPVMTDQPATNTQTAPEAQTTGLTKQAIAVMEQLAVLPESERAAVLADTVQTLRDLVRDILTSGDITVTGKVEAAGKATSSGKTEATVKAAILAGTIVRKESNPSVSVEKIAAVVVSPIGDAEVEAITVAAKPASETLARILSTLAEKSGDNAIDKTVPLLERMVSQLVQESANTNARLLSVKPEAMLQTSPVQTAHITAPQTESTPIVTQSVFSVSPAPTEAVNTTVTTTINPPSRWVAMDQAGDAVLRTVKYLSDSGGQQFTVRLVPESLGEMHIQVTRNADTMTINLVSSSPAVRDMLEAQLPELRQSLQQGGFDTAQVAVSSGLGSHRESLAFQRRRGQESWTTSSNAGVRKADGVEASISQSRVRLVTNHGGPLNVFI